MHLLRRKQATAYWPGAVAGVRNSSVIQYSNNANLNSGNSRAMFGVDATDFTLENITLVNTTPHGGSQAEALRANNKRILLNRVNVKSFQDTVMLQGAVMVTQRVCELPADRRGWRHRHVPGANRPHVFPYSQVVHINTAMGASVIPAGWQLNNATTAPNVQFWEYKSTDLSGAPVDVSQRLSVSRLLAASEAAQWSDPAFVLGWVPFTVNHPGSDGKPPDLAVRRRDPPSMHHHDERDDVAETSRL